MPCAERSVIPSLDRRLASFLSTLSNSEVTFASRSSTNLKVRCAISFLSFMPAILYTSKSLFSIFIPFSGTGVFILRSITVDEYEIAAALSPPIMPPAADAGSLNITK